MAAGTNKKGGYRLNVFENEMMRQFGSLQKKDIKGAAMIGANYPMVYICSPYAGDITGNVEVAKDLARYAIKHKHQPVLSHLLYPTFMSEETERDMALNFGVNLLTKCDKVWIYTGKNKIISDGMRVEISAARRSKIPITLVDYDHLYNDGKFDPLAAYAERRANGS